MTRSTRTTPRSVVTLLVLAVALLLGTATWLVVGRGTGSDATRPPAATSTATPSQSAPTETTPTPTTAGPVLLPVEANGAPDAALVRAALGDLITDGAFGSGAAVSVIDAQTGATLVDVGSATSHLPASTTKLLTAAGALVSLGPDATFTTSLVATAPGQVVLVGGGDPTLSQRTAPDQKWPYAVTPLADLATAAATALKAQGITTVRLSYAADRFVGPATSPTWPAGYVSSGQVASVSALSLDGGRRTPGMAARASDPAAYAADRFAALLASAGVNATVAGAVPTPVGATEVASIDSPPVADVVSQMLLRSDNDIAEMLARQIARAEGFPSSFEGIHPALTQILLSLGVPATGMVLADGSGLSRDNRIAPATLTALLMAAAGDDHADLRPLLTGLPVGGFTGTLKDRFEPAERPAGAGDVRAKTGYLSGVVALAGYVRDQDDQVLVFSFVSDTVPGPQTIDAQALMDTMALRLAACGCR
jgi:D-alanyl-D-alanine carboxypeptidase/D-alanyl-D-alanine-endopeptidase (penicillin-binding protein 4)